MTILQCFCFENLKYAILLQTKWGGKLDTDCFMMIFSRSIVQAQAIGDAFERCLAKWAVFMTQHLYSEIDEMLKMAAHSPPSIAIICGDNDFKIVTELMRFNKKLKIIMIVDDNQSAIDSFDRMVLGVLPRSPSDTQIQHSVERLLKKNTKEKSG